MTNDGIASRNLFLKRQNTIIRRSMFDVHQFLFRSDWTLAASGAARVKLHPGGWARIRAKTDNYSHQTHEKTRNIILYFRVLQRDSWPTIPDTGN
jgi:hypothetical protein